MQRLPVQFILTEININIIKKPSIELLVISLSDLNARINRAAIDKENNERIRDIVIVDTRTFPEYAKGHLPGAVNIDLMQFHWIDTSKEGIQMFNKQTKLLLSNIGVAENRFFVFYDNQSGSSAARGVWLLLYFSHNNVAMLDGGFEGWKAEGLPIETKTNGFDHTKFTGRSNPKIIANYATVKAAIKKNEKKIKKSNNKSATKVSIVLDTRTKAEFEGSVVRAARAGHISNAINIDWTDNLKDHFFKERQELAKIYSEIPKDAEIITYCQGGYRAANTFVVLKMLGYKNVKMYLGSWGEWGNRKDFPVSKSDDINR